MTLTTTAVYENGVLRPVQPLTLMEGETVQLTVTTSAPRPTEDEIIAMMKAAKSESHIEGGELVSIGALLGEARSGDGGMGAPARTTEDHVGTAASSASSGQALGCPTQRS